MLDLHEALWRGMELRSPVVPKPVPLDCLLFSDSDTLALAVGWWPLQSMSPQHVFRVAGLPERQGVQTWVFRGEGAVDPPVLLAPPSDGDVEALLARARDALRVDRVAYLAALALLRETEEAEHGYDFAPWATRIQALPELTALALFQERFNGERTIGRIVAVGAAGAPVDVLVLDEYGYAETLQEDGWLSLFAEQWGSFSEQSRPSVADFLDWLKGQSPPYESFELRDARVARGTGSLAALAFQAAETTLGTTTPTI